MKSQQEKTRSFRFNARRDTAIVFFVFLLLTPLWPFVLLIIAFVGTIIITRAIWARSKAAVIVFIAMLTCGIRYYSFLQYSVERQYQEVRNLLENYPDMSVGREYFPIPFIERLSLGEGTSDDDVESILNVKGLENIRSLSLESSDVTDSSLETIGDYLSLERIFIDCDQITDGAILEFQERFPDCSVIVFQKELFDDGVDVYLGPPNGPKLKASSRR